MQTFCQEIGLFYEDDEKMQKTYDDYRSDLSLMIIVAKSKEFENIRVREDEQTEIRKLLKDYWIFEETLPKPKKMPGDKNNDCVIVVDTLEKVLAVICGYLNKYEFENFSLTIDSAYVVQNSIRLLRCILDMSIKKNITQMVDLTLKWCKYLENRMTPFELPLRQFCFENHLGSFNTMRTKKDQKEGYLPAQLVHKLEQEYNGRIFQIEDLEEMDVLELAAIMETRPQMGKQMKKYLDYLPKIDVEYDVKPVAQTILKVSLKIYPKWTWSARWHTKSEPFLISVDDEREILHNESITISRKIVQEKGFMESSFYIPFRETKNFQYRLKVTSDFWVNAEFFDIINLQDIIMNMDVIEHTNLLDVSPLSTLAFNNPLYENLYKFKFFNPIQTQIFHLLYHTNNNIIVGAPTGSGKTNIAEIAMLRSFNEYPNMMIVYVAPMKALAKERLKDWRKRFEQGPLNKKVLEVTGDFTPDLEALNNSNILITTPEKWDGITRNWQHRNYVQRVSLMILDEIHLLGQDRGPVIEMIVSRMNYIADQNKNKIRMLGLSTAMANGSDIANWFGVEKHCFFNFKPQVRPCPVTIYFDGFAEKHYCPRMATMNKPAYNSIKKFSDGKPVLIFVSSRRQTRLTALDLIALSSMDAQEDNPFLKIKPKEMNAILEYVKDSNLKQTLAYGVGMHHAGLITEDRQIVEDLFVSNKIQVMIATSTLAWGVNFPARLVIIKGTEFYDAKQKKYVDVPVTDILQMIGRAGRPQFDDRGIACVFVEQSKKNFYRKYLNDPFPIESNLLSQLNDHLNAEISSGTLTNKQNCMDFLSWTYFFRRILKNPSFYGLKDTSSQSVNKYLIDLVDGALKRLEEHGCIKLIDEYNFEPTFLGYLSSFYYIKHETIWKFKQQLKQLNLELQLYCTIYHMNILFLYICIYIE